MPEDTPGVLRRLARAIRAEAAGIEARQLAEGQPITGSQPDSIYQRGRRDGYREAARLLDDGEES